MGCGLGISGKKVKIIGKIVVFLEICVTYYSEVEFIKKAYYERIKY